MTNHKSHDPKRIVVDFDRAAKAAPDPAADAEAVSEEPVETGAPEPAELPQAERAAAFQDQIGRLQTEKNDLLKTLVQRQADFENYRKRVERDRQEESRRGVARLIEDLLPVLDAFDRALKAHNAPEYEEYRKGMELIYGQIWSLLSRHGLEKIEAADKIFDPHFHQAIERVDTSDRPDGTIIEVLQDGYVYHGRVLRPSIVRVAVN